MYNKIAVQNTTKIIRRRINITLSDETIELIERVIEKGDSLEETLRDRSRFIN
ncbi:hypothetical protein [Nostoc edaphicum]|uniref:hypothetical protein n=1 Tax=Nostoc edaphicum TaxID=264686 RepID=UPI001D13D3B1|nr:hypothetical protein [Nostoc edaphicum]